MKERNSNYINLEMEFIPNSGNRLNLSRCGQYLYLFNVYGNPTRLPIKENLDGIKCYTFINSGLHTEGKSMAFSVEDLVSWTFTNNAEFPTPVAFPPKKQLIDSIGLLRASESVPKGVIDEHWCDLPSYPNYKQNAITGAFMNSKGNVLKFDKNGQVSIRESTHKYIKLDGGQFYIDRVLTNER